MEREFRFDEIALGSRQKQARKSSEDAQATGYTRLEKVQAGQIWGRKSLGPTY